MQYVCSSGCKLSEIDGSGLAEVRQQIININSAIEFWAQGRDEDTNRCGILSRYNRPDFGRATKPCGEWWRPAMCDCPEGRYIGIIYIFFCRPIIQASFLAKDFFL